MMPRKAGKKVTTLAGRLEKKQQARQKKAQRQGPQRENGVHSETSKKGGGAGSGNRGQECR